MVQKITSLITLVLFLAAVSFVFVQCGDGSDNTNQTVEDDSTTVILNNQNTSYIKEREELVSDLENLRGELDGTIENLDSKIKNDEADESLLSMKDQLTEDRSEVQLAIENLHNSTQDTWDRRKTETENLYERISSNLDRWNN